MANQNWWVTSSPISVPGGTTTGGGGYGTDAISYRDQLDARRSMAGQESAYPDGYLGTITNRQQDKLLAAVKNRLNERSYQRGVHVGGRIGQDQYLWSPGFNPEIGLARQAGAVQDGNVIVTARFAPALDPTERLAHMGKAAITSPELMGLARQTGVDPGTSTPRAQLATMLPSWR
jgi:hypothetical protein